MGSPRSFPLRALAEVTGRAASIGLISGGVAGLLAGGIGSRLAMRLIAAAGGPGIQGLETENGNLIGEITADGTVLLIVAGAILGAFGGLIYVAARSWLPGRIQLRAPLYGAFVMFLAAVLLLDKENSDFVTVGHPVLSVTLFAAIPFLYGVVQVLLTEWLDRKLPALRPSGTASVFYALASLVVILPVVPIIGGGLSANDGPLVLLVLLPLALIYVLLFLNANPSLSGRRYADPIPFVVRITGYAVLCLVGGMGAYRFVDSVSHILNIRS